MGNMENVKCMLVLSLCALVVFTLVSDVNAQCSLIQLNQCMNAVTRGAEPAAGCCAQLANADFGCFCNLVQRGSYPPEYVNNAVRVPQRCGGQAYMKFKGKSCAGRYIP